MRSAECGERSEEMVETSHVELRNGVDAPAVQVCSRYSPPSPPSLPWIIRSSMPLLGGPLL